MIFKIKFGFCLIVYGIQYIIYIKLYIVYNILNIIEYIKYSILYKIIKYKFLFHIILTFHYTILQLFQWKVDFLSQHSTSIFSISLFFDNDYGTIISFKLVLPNMSLNMNVLKLICTISKLAFKVLCLIRKCHKW
jgi:hypothetical protein